LTRATEGFLFLFVASRSAFSKKVALLRLSIARLHYRGATLLPRAAASTMSSAAPAYRVTYNTS